MDRMCRLLSLKGPVGPIVAHLLSAHFFERRWLRVPKGVLYIRCMDV